LPIAGLCFLHRAAGGSGSLYGQDWDAVIVSIAADGELLACRPVAVGLNWKLMSHDPSPATRERLLVHVELFRTLNSGLKVLVLKLRELQGHWCVADVRHGGGHGLALRSSRDAAEV